MAQETSYKNINSQPKNEKREEKKGRKRKKLYSQVEGQMGEGHSKVSETQWWGQRHSMVTDEWKNMRPQTISKGCTDTHHKAGTRGA